jgi:hypothetical protein
MAKLTLRVNRNLHPRNVQKVCYFERVPAAARDFDARSSRHGMLGFMSGQKTTIQQTVPILIWFHVDRKGD